MIAIRPQSRQILGVNQQSYQALKASMSLNLRRQLLIAVCDSATLQDQLATQLENDLRQESLSADSFDPAVSSPANADASVVLDRLVFDPEDAHLPRQVAQWVRQTMLAEGQLPQLQMLGIEQMTRQSATVQNHFLRSLEKVEALLPRLNTSLLIWVPWPWLRTIQSSAPTFWRWRSGVFEFVSDPTPANSVWDESLDPNMFDDEFEASSAVDDLVGGPESSLVDEADRPLSQDDFVSDYAESGQGAVSLYGESGECDRPMRLPKASAELTTHPIPASADPEGQPAPELVLTDDDFAQSLIKDFAQKSTELPAIESLDESEDDPFGDLVITPLIEPQIIEPQIEPQIEPHAEMVPQIDSSDLQVFDEKTDEPSEKTSDQAIVQKVTAENAVLAAVEEVEVEQVEVEESEVEEAEVEEAKVALSTQRDSQNDEWGLLAAVTLAFQSNLAEAQRLKAVATKWISKSSAEPAQLPDQSGPEIMPGTVQQQLADADVVVTPLAHSEILELEPEVEILELEPELEELDLEEPDLEEPELEEPDLEEPEASQGFLLEMSEPDKAELTEHDLHESKMQSVLPATPEPEVLEPETPEPEAAKPSVIRVQVASLDATEASSEPAKQLPDNQTSTAFVAEADALDISGETSGEILDEVLDDLDFSDDLEQDLVVSEAESVGEELPFANLPTADLPTEGSASDEAAQSVMAAPVLPEEATAVQRRTQPQRDRQDTATEYFAIGYRYRARIESGDSDLGLIESAIAAYEGGLQCISGPHPDWASGLNDLGTLYWLKAQQLSDAQQEWDCMNHSISLYQQALTKIDAQQLPEMVCQLYSNMGAVYSILATYAEPVEHLQKAVNVYCQALRKCPLSVDPVEYATLNNSLGSVYWKLSHYEEVPQNLQHAIAAYSQALRGYNPIHLPLEYASVQNNIGITYWSLAKHEASVPSLKHAITAYYEALKYRTADIDPAACAVTYNNLALAYWDLSKEKDIEADPRMRYQKNAITAFEAALNTAEGANTLSEVDSAAIYHCLGDVHAQMAEAVTSLQEIAQSLQKSLHSYVRAISGLTEESPVFQARLSAIIANLRSHYEHLGLASQQSALNRIPPNLLSEVMVAL